VPAGRSGPGRGGPDRRGVRDQNTAWSALGPHGSGNPGFPAGASGHDGYTEPAGQRVSPRRPAPLERPNGGFEPLIPGIHRIAVLIADYSPSYCVMAQTAYTWNPMKLLGFCVINYLNPPSWGRGVVSNLSRVDGTRTVDIMPNELILRQQIATTEDVLPCRTKHSLSGCLQHTQGVRLARRLTFSGE
jgi:hypothetical protein